MKDGGPAFPGSKSFINQMSGKTEIYEFTGISARDYFAAAALTGLLARGPLAGDADRAYEYADAMLAARERD